MGFKHFRIIAVAAAILVGAAFFVFLLNYRGRVLTRGEGEMEALLPEKETGGSEEFKDIK